MRGKRKAYYASKIKRASHLLFFRRHRKPGVKGWELRKHLGKDYPQVLKILNGHLEPLDLQIKTVFEEERPTENPRLDQLDKARFFVTLRGSLTSKEAKMIGWRIDDLAGLAATIAYIVSRKGKASRKNVEKLLKEKLPRWRADLNLDRYVRYGYISQDEKEQLYLGWRTLAEIDQKALIDLLLGTEKEAISNA